MRHLILLLPVVLFACATPGPSGSGIHIDTASMGQPLSGASCVVHTNNGNWIVNTPGLVNVGPVNGDLRIVCEKAGYLPSEVQYKVFSPGNPSVGIGISGGGGSAGFGLGLNIPVGSGAAGYPSKVTVEMRMH
jgi:hypothetical protein